jgi:nitronate monooxygenase
MSHLSLKGKSLDIPIIQGGMGIGVSLGNLAGHVMREGGMGVISAAQPGFRDPDFRKNPIQANIKALDLEIKKARELSLGKGLLGINLMVAAEAFDVYARAIAKMDVDAIICGAGLPLDLPDLFAGSSIALAPIVSSAKAAVLICRRWLSRFNRLPDFLIIEGPMAGGHLGFSWDQLNTNQLPSLETIFEEVKEQLQQLKINLPIFVAGGIYTGSDIAKFIKAGAAGVQMGTRFIATHECDADEQFKQTFLKMKKEDIRYVISPSGYPGRAYNNSLVQKLMNQEKIKVNFCTNCLKPCNPATTPYCITEALINAALGKIEKGLVFTGENGYRIEGIVKVSELIDELMHEMKVALV